MKSDSSDPVRPTVARRGFLRAAGAAGLGLTAAQLLVQTATRAVAADNFANARAGQGDVHFSQVRSDFPGIPGETTNEVVLNFALTLEILEADLYRQALNAASGLPNTRGLRSTTAYALAIDHGGLSTAARRAGFAYLRDFAFVEAMHRDFLITAINQSGFTPTVANPNGYAFPGGSPGTNLKAILANILAVEETGVRAYLGALPYLTDLNLGVTAGGIYSTECRHSAAIRYVVGQDIGPSRQEGDLSVSPNLQEHVENVFEFGLAPATVISAAGAYFVN
ncbi:MAG: ferritin-like domain-containing protein [Tepidisphaeraceae bacterium]